MLLVMTVMVRMLLLVMMDDDVDDDHDWVVMSVQHVEDSILDLSLSMA